MEIRDLRPLMAVVAAMVVIDALWNPVVLLWAFLLPGSFQALIVPIATEVDLSSSVFKIVTMIVFAFWIYRAGRNLIAANIDDLEFTPASRIWWFAVPVASLFKPFQGMRELWNASRGVMPYDTSDGLVATWWALWLVSNVSALILNAATREGGDNTIILGVGSAIDIAQAVVAIILIRGITQGQRGLDGSNLEEVFA
jgi:hypothetical protein